MSNPLHRLLTWEPIAHLPVRVRGGIAAGARWTFFPWSAYWRGTHEPDVQQRILALHSDWTGKHIWDLGSHYGLYAIGLARRVGPAGSVAAFEPNPRSYARLQLHVRRNHLTNLSTYPYAVSNVAGQQRFFLYEGLETTTSHLAYEDETWHASIPTMTVPTARLDDLVQQGTISLPDFIKVDVEGHGAKALAGAIKSLQQARPALLIGFHSQNEVDGILDILTPLNYRISPVTAQAPPDPTSGFDYIFDPIK